MGKKAGKNKQNTVFFLLVRPILAMLLILISVYTILMHQNVLSYLKKNAITVFQEQVSGRKLSIYGDMVNRWSKIQDSVEKIVKNLEEIIEGQGADISDIHVDAALNQQIIQGLMEDIIGTLRACGGTEVFLVLDGIAVESDEKDNLKAGVYLRNNNPYFYSNDNQDLLFERGVPAISKNLQISLDSFWAAGFDFSDETNENNFYYLKPFHAARESDNKDFRNFAYWSYGYPVNDLDRGVLTYSVPLIASDGSVVGVMGIGISEKHFKELMNYKELEEGGNGGYFLAKTSDGVNFEPVIFNGPAYNKNIFLSHSVQISGGEGNPLQYVYLGDEKDSSLCADVEFLQLYNHNTPFEEEKWALVGIQPERQLLAAYYSAEWMLVILAGCGTVVGIIGIFLTSRLVSRPLRRLMEELRRSNTHKPIHLQRLKVEEIDELIQAIESLSGRVAASSSKISTIIQMAESGIGVYEYLKKDARVFCSRSLYEILQWHPVVDTHEYIDSTLFLKRMSVLEGMYVAGEKNLYEIVLEDKSTKWIRLNQVEDEDSIIGVVTDVTAAILEKRQIEYQRDFDVLTNLYNLRAFHEQLQLLASTQEEKLKIGALVMWDLDNLKFVNDVYGHHTGDAYIISLADCLRGHQSLKVISARRSGDEFYTVLFGFEDKEQLKKTLEVIWEEIQNSHITLPNGRSYKLRVSAGVAWYPEHSRDFTELLRYADFAMYMVKHNRKGNMAYFDPAVYQEDWFLTQGQGDFNTLLDNRLVRYAAQPIAKISDGSVYGYEMLMRPEMPSFQTPADVLRMAHAQSRLYDVEVMTWFESLKTYCELVEQGKLEPGSRIFINSVSNQMLRKDMVRLLENKYAAYLPLVVCEFTEEEQRGNEVTAEKLEFLHKWNAKSAIDDYGCGYNGETILLELHPDIVKIDMGIVRGIHTDENRKRLVQNLILYAHERNIQVLGEGVETPEELKALIDLGIDLVQGYYIAKPSFEGTPPSAGVRKEMTDYYRRSLNK